MYITDLSCKCKTEYIIDSTDHTKSIYKHKNAFAHFVIREKDDCQRHISQCCAHNGKHCRDTCYYKPEPWFFNSNNKITNQCNHSLQESDQRYTDSIAENHILYFMAQQCRIFIF